MANYLDFTGLSYYTEKLTTKISNDINTAIASLPIIISLEDNNTTKAGNWLAKTSQITSLEEGQLFLYKLTYAGASTTYLTITCSGTTTSKLTVYRYGTTKLTTQYAVGSYLLLYYTGSAYRVVNDYDANNYAYVRQYQSGPAGASASTQYALLARYNLTDKDDTYDTAYTRYHTSTYLDVDDGSIHSPAFYENGVALSSKYALSSAIPAAVTESTVSGWGFTKNTGNVTGSSLTNDCIIGSDSDNGIKASAVSVSDLIGIANGAPKAYVIHANSTTNKAFNSTEFIITPNGDSFTTIDNDVINFTDIRIGDVIYIIETDVPDRWCSGEGSFAILETNISGKLDKTTYEWNKELACGSNGKVCLGKFGCYDSNVTIELRCTTSTTYSATIVIATQNIAKNSTGGTIQVGVYGDASNSITPLLSIFRPYGSADRLVEVYANLPGWSKNFVHVKQLGAASTETVDILTSVTEIPTSITNKTKLTNDGTVGNGKVCNLLKSNYLSSITSSMVTTALGYTPGTSNFTGYTSSNKLSTNYINNEAGWTSVTESTVSNWGFTKNTGDVTTNTTQTISGAKTFTATDTIISGSGFSTTNNLLIPTDDSKKLKEILKYKKIKLEISNIPLNKKREKEKNIPDEN